MELEELEKRIEDNAQQILTNLEKIKSNSDKIEGNAEKIQQNSYALEILKDYKKQNKRLFIVLIIMLAIWIGTLILFHL